MNRPTDPLRQMQELTERLREAMALQRHRRAASARTWQPPMDLSATEDAYVIVLDVPGAAREDLEATAEEGIVRVRGEVNPPEDVRHLQRLRGERTLGRFSRSIRLPSDADTTNTSAALADGVLTITVARHSGSGRITIDIEE
ncbi:MAG: Hsp20/alpha crystallin family protein [Armatimonadota bacterium]